MTDMGHGGFSVENKIRNICGGGINIAVWFFMNCARFEVIKEAGAQEWDAMTINDEDTTVIKEVRGPFFMIYACREGTKNIDYEQSESKFIQYLKETLDRNQGRIELGRALLHLPEQVGEYVPMAAGH